MTVKNLKSTGRIVFVNSSFPCRVWEGELEDGTAIAMLVPRVGIAKEEHKGRQNQFDEQLKYHIKASDYATMMWPDRVHIDLP